MDPISIPIDWSPVLKSPLVVLIPITAAVVVLTWIFSEAMTFVVPVKYRPVLPLVFGPCLGWTVNRTEILDFGWGPFGWGRALFFGACAGVVCLLAHDWIKEKWPFSILARKTPSSQPIAPAPPAGGTP